jgi:putative transcriptional regulator
MYNQVRTKGGKQMAIKVHLSRLMGERKLKISDLAKMTGLHRNGLTELYHEKTNGIKFDTLEKICRALECDICDLLEIVDGPKKEEKK